MDKNSPTSVRAALSATKGKWQEVAIGSGVSYSWISKFMNGKIDNPGYSTLDKLSKHLEAKSSEASRQSQPAEQGA